MMDGALVREKPEHGDRRSLDSTRPRMHRRESAVDCSIGTGNTWDNVS